MGAVVVETSIVWLQVSNYMIYGYFQKKITFFLCEIHNAEYGFCTWHPLETDPLLNTDRLRKRTKLSFLLAKVFMKNWAVDSTQHNIFVYLIRPIEIKAEMIT